MTPIHQSSLQCVVLVRRKTTSSGSRHILWLNTGSRMVQGQMRKKMIKNMERLSPETYFETKDTRDNAYCQDFSVNKCKWYIWFENEIILRSNFVFLRLYFGPIWTGTSSFHFEEMICTSGPDKTSYYQAGCTFQKPFYPWSGSAPPPINNIMDNLATLQPNSKQHFTIFQLLLYLVLYFLLGSARSNWWCNGDM